MNDYFAVVAIVGGIVLLAGLVYWHFYARR